MRIIRPKSAGNLSEETRRRLHRIFYKDSDTALADLKGLFPNHVVSVQYGHIRVADKKGPIILDLFKDGCPKMNWNETNVRLRMTGK